MKFWTRKAVAVAVLATGALALTPAAAQADVRHHHGHHHSGGVHNNGILNGNQVYAPVSIVAIVSNNVFNLFGGN